MEIHRTHVLFLGILLMFLGAQFRMVTAFTMTADATRWVEAKIRNAHAAMQKENVRPTSYSSARPTGGYTQDYYPGCRRIVKPPRWVGLALLAAGAILTLHALVLHPRH